MNGAFNPFKTLFSGDGEQVYNAILLLDAGAVAAWRGKYNLCDYSVFDEKRLFKQGALPGPMNFRGVRLGTVICEDLWWPEVTECLAESGAEILVTLNGSHFEPGKLEWRIKVGVSRVQETDLPLIYVNQVCGQDDVVFDGGSFVLNADCSLQTQLPMFAPAVATTRWERGDDDVWRCVEGSFTAPDEGQEETYQALMLGLTRLHRKRTAFPVSFSACPAASTPRCRRRSPSMPWARSGCTA